MNKNRRDNKGKKNYNSYRPKSSKGKDRENDTVPSEERSKCYVPQGNPVEWYKNFPVLFDQATKVPFTNITGRDIWQLGNTTLGAVRISDYGRYIPGVMVLNTINTLGCPTNATDPANRAAREVFTSIRNHRTGYTSYDYPTVAMYLAAVDSILTIYATVVRAYGLYRAYEVTNAYFPQGIIQSLGLDWENMINQITKWEAFIEYMSLQLVNLPVPTNINIFARHMLMYSGVYADRSTWKASMYAFNPSHIWEYVPTEGKMKLTSLYGNRSQITINDVTYGTQNSRNLYLSDLQTMFDRLVTTLITDDDMRLVASDIYSVYKGNLMTFPSVTSSFMVSPVYDETMLTMIQNATFVGLPSMQSSVEYANAGDPTKPLYVKENITTFLSQDSCIPHAFSKKILTLPHDNPTADEIMEATRLTNLPFDVYLKGVSLTAGGTAGTNGAFVTWQKTTSELLTNSVFCITHEDSWSIFATHSGAIESDQISMLTKFDWAPAYNRAGEISQKEVISNNSTPWITSVQGTYNGPIQDVDVIASIGATDLANLNDAALYSLWSAPIILK